MRVTDGIFECGAPISLSYSLVVLDFAECKCFLGIRMLHYNRTDDILKFISGDLLVLKLQDSQCCRLLCKSG